MLKQTTSKPRVVIVGAGFGGLYAAKALRNAPVDATIVDRRNHHLFQPLLYQVATAGLSPGDIAHPIRAILSRQQNARVLLGEVKRIDAANRKVYLDDEEIGYDYLIVATGAGHNYFGHPEWEKFAPALSTLEDALEIRRQILLAFEKAEREPLEVRRGGLLTFAIVGGGPTGVELAGAIAEIAFSVMTRDFRAINPKEAHIILLEGAGRVLETFPEELSQRAEESLKKLGVEIRTNCRVMSIEEGRVVTSDREITAATILWAAGAKASPLLATLETPMDRGGRVSVNPDLTVPGHPEVFVVGDSASFVHQTGKPLPGVAQVAIQQGKHAAGNIVRAMAGQPQTEFHYTNYGNMATIGRALAVADFGWMQLSGFIAWAAWLTIHIFWLIGFRNRIVVLVEWAWAYFSSQRSARLITGDIDKMS